MKNDQADRIELRLVDFAVQIILLSDKLHPTRASQHIAQQILRSGRSPAPNYGEARGAESRTDFVHKLGIALKELNETKVWLKLIERARFATDDSVQVVLDECQQLTRVVNASIQTARRNAR